MDLNVLVVDDDMINRKLLKSYFKRKSTSINVIEAENGAEALDKFKENDIDLILLDIVMPILDGVGFLKKFRSDSENLEVPIIILSTDDSRKTEVLENGANSFLTKPVSEKDFFDKINIYKDILEK